MARTDTTVTSAQLVVSDGTGAALVPAQKLILTRAPQVARLAALTEAASAFTEITLDTHGQAKSLLADVRATRKQVEQFHDAQKAPLNLVRSRALDLEKEDVAPFKTLETALGAKLLAFDAEVERQRKAEQARLQAEAVEKARREADERAKALRAAAKAEDDLATKKQLNAQAKALKDAPVFVAPVVVAAPVAAVSTVTRWSAEITDLEALVVAVAVGILKRRATVGQFTSMTILAEQDAPLAALEPERLMESHPWLNSSAAQGREEFRLPGVVAVSKTGLSGR